MEGVEVEVRGLEPLTSGLQSPRSSKLSYTPIIRSEHNNQSIRLKIHNSRIIIQNSPDQNNRTFQPSVLIVDWRSFLLKQKHIVQPDKKQEDFSGRMESGPE